MEVGEEAIKEEEVAAAVIKGEEGEVTEGAAEVTEEVAEEEDTEGAGGCKMPDGLAAAVEEEAEDTKEAIHGSLLSLVITPHIPNHIYEESVN